MKNTQKKKTAEEKKERQNQEVQASFLSREERIGKGVISYMKKMAPFDVGFYLSNISTYSPHTSDSEGTGVFKAFMTQKLGDR